MILLDSLTVDGFKGLRRLELRFPSDGAVLVEGLNEAGKSTLFESVYFALYGSPLVTETPRGGPEDVISYGRDTCTVCLTLAVGDSRLEASRTARRGRPSQATLVVSRPGRDPETVQGVRAVNARVVEELGNLDGDALLNSCFVEQKKLSKLEDLTADKRKESLLRLLNLERLGDLEASLRPTRVDEQEASRARRRSELADLQAALPPLRAELEAVERSLVARAVRGDLIALAAHERTAREARAARGDAEARVARVAALRGRAALLESEQEAVRLEDELAAFGPGLEAAERRLAAAREVLHRFELSDALAQWIRLHRSVELRQHGDQELREAETEVAARQAEHQEAVGAAARRRAAFTAAAALGVAAVVAAGLLVSAGRLDQALAVGAVVLGLGVLAARQLLALQAASTAALVAESTLTEARVKAQTIHGQRVAAVNLLGGESELARCQSTLAALGEEIPQDEEGARARHAEAEKKLVLLDRATVVATQRAAERAVRTIEQDRVPLAARVALLRDGRAAMAESDLDDLAREVERGALGLGIAPAADGEGHLPAIAGAESSLQSSIGQAIERETTAEASSEAGRERLRRGLASLLGTDTPWSGDLTLEAVQAACPLVAEVASLEQGEAESRRDNLRAEGLAAEREATRLSSDLGLDGTTLDPEECRAEVARLERLAAVKRRAVEIVAEARKRMVARVLPNTERNFRLLLPRLTAGRYRDARITDDYRIEVWDEAAGRYVAKSIFSGGTRDQFSLALRLAFALATLPEELGTSPGFLFLDEPLSSFDGPRTQALVDLLTRGEVAASFRQIFVISHSRSFDASAFRYRLVLAHGAIVESTLPTG